MILYALNLMSYGLAGFFFWIPMTNMDKMVIEGGLDAYLTQPVNPLFHLASRQFNVGYMTHVGLSLVVLLGALSSLGITWTPFKAFYLMLTVFGAALIQSTVFLISGSAAFWLTRTQSLRILLWGFRDFISYPLSIYGQAIRFLLTFVIPFGFINFYPAEYLLGKGEMLFHPALQFLTPLVGLGMFWLAYAVWRRGLNAYQGAGS